MAYKNIEDQRNASRRHYQANRSRYLARNKAYRAEIVKFVRDLKEAVPCADCKLKFPYYVMDFDHLGSKEFEINILTHTGRIGALKRELKKCEIVCANCHRARTHNRALAPP